MKHLFLNKTKLLTIGLLLIFVSARPQNKMYFTIQEYDQSGDSLVDFSDTINITTIRENSWMTSGVATDLINYKNYPRIINNSANRIYINQKLAAITGWGTTAINNCAVGNYSGSGLDVNQQNLHRLYFSSQLENADKRNELIIRLRHELEARNATLMDALIDSVCIGLRYSDSTAVAGKLIYHSQTNGTAYLQLKNNNGLAWIANWYTISKATDEEKGKYY